MQSHSINFQKIDPLLLALAALLSMSSRHVFASFSSGSMAFEAFGEFTGRTPVPLLENLMSLPEE
jgi:hypothetical protein